MAQRQSLGVILRRLLHIRLGVLKQHPGCCLPSMLNRTSIYADELPFISVVIPSFKQGGYISRTVSSILDQQYAHVEIIIQDNLSPDNTLEVVRSFSSDKIRFYAEKDNGQADAINRGFNKASGDILCYLNSDDILLPGALNRVVEQFLRDPQIDAIYGDRLIIDEQDCVVGRWVLPYHDDVLLHTVDYVPQETLFWRRSLWTRIGGRVDDTLSFALDWDLLLRFIKARAKLHHIPVFLGAFRVHADQKTTSQYDEVGRAEMKEVRKRYPLGFGAMCFMPIRHIYFLLRHIRADKKSASNVSDWT